jgi:prolyl oligopeptidase
VVDRALRRFGDAPDGLSGALIGGCELGEALVDDGRVAVVSATGSTAMGRAVGPRLAARFARAILELGGNNAAIVAPSADLDLAVRAIAFAAKRRTPWAIGDVTHAPDSLLGHAVSAFFAGDRNFTVLFAPGERRALQSFFWADGQLVLSILDELQPTFEVLIPSADGWARSKLSMAPKIGVVQVWRLDTEEAERNGDLLAAVQDPITPPALMMINRTKSWEVLKRAPQAFPAAGLMVTHHEAVSVDGERIPYVQVGPAKQTGDAPVHLSGYGGFGIASRPYYNCAIGKLWSERGGTRVIANIRGGGEFGTRWP